MSGYIYLASPYTAPTPSLRRERFRYALRATRTLMERGEVVFSPIVYGHLLEDKLHRSFEHSYWLLFGSALLAGASHLYVLTAPGWEESVGIRAEVTLAHSLNIPVLGIILDDPGFEDVSGYDILGHFGLAPRRTARPLNLPKDNPQED